ncbi:MAG: tail fiber domain-containing protein [Verrucomicrobiales bacterium]
MSISSSNTSRRNHKCPFGYDRNPPYKMKPLLPITFRYRPQWTAGIYPVALFSLCLSLFGKQAGAAPQLLPFQGHLTSAAGEAIDGEAKVVQFKIYDAPVSGSAVWAGEVHKLSVNDGLVNTILGTKTAFPEVYGANSKLMFSEPLYLEITVDAQEEGQSGHGVIDSADPPLLPRQIILPANFAHAASYATEAEKSNSLTNGANILTGTIPNARLDDDIQDLADGTLSGSKVGSGINAVNVSEGILGTAQIPNISAGKITTGVLSNDVMPVSLRAGKQFHIQDGVLRLFESDGQGIIDIEGPNGLLNFSVHSTLGPDHGWMGLYDDEEDKQVSIGVNVGDDGYGLWYGSNNTRNVYIGRSLNSVDASGNKLKKGAVMVCDEFGDYRVAMFVDENGRGTVARDRETQYSDIRLKEDIQSLDGCLDRIMKLRGVSYLRRDWPNAGRQMGFIAQEVQKVLPDAVSVIEFDSIAHGGAGLDPKMQKKPNELLEESPPQPAAKDSAETGQVAAPPGFAMPDKPLAISTDSFLPLLIEAVKEQQAQIDDLRKQIEALQKVKTLTSISSSNTRE